jgi:6,7-dimethyl-8-ribityllumazine synthase
MKGIVFPELDGSELKIGITVARWNAHITDKLVDGCKDALLEVGVKENNILVQQVPGSYELPFAAQHLIKKENVDAVVCLGTLVKGETMHFEYISEAVTQGIMDINLAHDVPVIFGILTCLTEEQAMSRASGDNNHGYAWGKSAVEMALLKK